MNVLSQSELQRLITIMRKMERAAIEKNWQELSRLDDLRRELIEYDAAKEVSAGESSVQKSNMAENTMHTDLVNEIVQLDALIIESVLNARHKLLAENRDLSAQVNAKARYELTSQFS